MVPFIYLKHLVGFFMEHELRSLEDELEQLRLEEKFVRENLVFSSVAVQSIIDFVASTPEPFGNGDKDLVLLSRAEKRKRCVITLLCIKVAYPTTIYQYLRRKICEPILHQNYFKYVERKERKLGIMKKLFSSKQPQNWYERKVIKQEITETAKSIDSWINRERGKLEKNSKFLLLGSRGSGKSTLLKQLKLLFLNGFSKAELMGYKPILHLNTLVAAQSLVRGCHTLGIELNSKVAKEIEQMSIGFDTVIDPETASDLDDFWGSEEIQQCFQQRYLLNLPENTHHLMKHVSRFKDITFLPTASDLMWSYFTMPRVDEVEFDYEGRSYSVIDFGNRGNERRKWIHCFGGVDAIIFTVDLSSYNKKPYVDEDITEIDEACVMFDEIINMKLFSSTKVFLLLNKSDVFKEKIAKIDLASFYRDCKEGLGFEEGCKYMGRKFEQLNRFPEREIKTFVCCAVDTGNMNNVLYSFFLN